VGFETAPQDATTHQQRIDLKIAVAFTSADESDDPIGTEAVRHVEGPHDDRGIGQ
jgi:hypothetical protein